MFLGRRLGAGALVVLFLVSSQAAAGAVTRPNELKLPNGDTAMVYANGVVHVFSKDRRESEITLVGPEVRYDGPALRKASLDKAQLVEQLTRRRLGPFARNRVIVVYRDGTSALRDVVSVERATLRAATAYTNNVAVNHALAAIGVDRSERLFRDFNRSTLSALSTGGNGLDLANAYRLHVSAISVVGAVRTLSKLPQIAYVSPDWTVSPMHAQGLPIRPDLIEAAKTRARLMAWRPLTEEQTAESKLPSNYTLTFSAQSLLNAPGTNAAAAFDEIEAHFHQLPGQGEIITNVSLGDLDDASAASNQNDSCWSYARFDGPTTIVQGGQRYLDLPSMPLIPAYTADDSGNASGLGEVCGIDPYLEEIGLDFSMMAPLPHDLQRSGEQGSGLTDLLGVAPGAAYRLVVPASYDPGISDIDAAFLAAAMQTPRPNVITSSLGFGEDTYGFPSRYLEEDPLTETIVRAIVQQYNITFCLSGGDGTRTYTTAAIGPSGGSSPTNVIPASGTPTNLNDDYLSTIPSLVFDSGAIDVGGTTLDDIFSNPPQYATSPQAIAQHAYAETRWTGFTTFSSGYGTRVNISAPADNVLAFEHTSGGGPDAVTVIVQGGTSASAPETAASAAILLQLGRLTGHPFANPLQLRRFMTQTATPVAPVAQADATPAVGPQINLRAAVEAMLKKSNVHLSPRVVRVGIEQRRDYGDLDGAFVSDTDSHNIDLGPDPASTLPDLLAWITIAPDWESLPAGVTYHLFVTGHRTSTTLAVTPWARLLPATILAAAGLPLISGSSRTVQLRYEASVGRKVVASTTVPLTFGPLSVSTVSGAAPAPQVAPVASGTSIAVTYDLSNVTGLNAPELVVSEPGRLDPVITPNQPTLFHPAYTVALSSQAKGTVKVPLSALQGGGVYGVGIELDSTKGLYSDFAFTRVPGGGTERPQAPLLSIDGSVPGHLLEIPYGVPFQVRYDVNDVAGATGAMLEVSAAGPGAWNIYNSFNNPNGSVEDDNGVDTGSVSFVPLAGTSGTYTVNAASVLYPAMNHVVRVIPMRGGQAAGEGSDVSTVTMDGVRARDGGAISGGWGINANGLDGFITSAQQLASGETLSSVETFDQLTNQIVQTSVSSTGNAYLTTGWGIYGGDVGLFGTQNATTFTTSFNLLDPVASGTIGSAWTPPAFTIDAAAPNTTNDTAAFVGVSPALSYPYDWGVLSSNIVGDTFSSVFDINPPIRSFADPFYFGIALNTGTNTAILPVADELQYFNPPTLVTLDLTTGNTSSFTGVGSGFPYGIALDTSTGKAAVPTLADGGLTIYNLANNAGNEIFMPQPPNGGASGQYPIADTQHGLFLVEQTVAPTVAVDNNSLSRVLVYDENGNLLETIARFNLYNTFTSVLASQLQITPGTRSGYLIGPNQQQLQPFKY